MSSYQLDPRWSSPIYTCWQCSTRQGEVAFNSRNSFRSHLVFHHSSDIERRKCPTDKGYEDVVVCLDSVELAAKRRKFQLRTASPTERRAIYNLERRQFINILPCYVPSLSSQATVGMEEEQEVQDESHVQLSEVKLNEEKHEGQDGRQQTPKSSSQVWWGEEEEEDEGKTQQLAKQQVLADTMVDEQMEQKKRNSVVISELSSEGQSIDIDYSLINIPETPEVGQADYIDNNCPFQNIAEIDWGDEFTLVSLLPELNYDNKEAEMKPEQYRVSTPGVPETEQTVADSVAVSSSDPDRKHMTYGREDPISMTDVTVRQEDVNIIDCNVVDDVDDVRPGNVIDTDNIERSVTMHNFDMQVNALMQQISAETLMFNDVPIDNLADRIGANSAILANAEIRRLVHMSAVSSKNLAIHLLKKFRASATLTPDANVALASLMSDLVVIAERPL